MFCGGHVLRRDDGHVFGGWVVMFFGEEGHVLRRDDGHVLWGWMVMFFGEEGHVLREHRCYEAEGQKRDQIRHG